jgi:hypothetical protein
VADDINPPILSEYDFDLSAYCSLTCSFSEKFIRNSQKTREKFDFSVKRESQSSNMDEYDSVWIKIV